MKTFLLNALFMGLTALGFAQPAFTEKTLTDMRQRMLTDWDNYFKDEVSPDYVMMGHVGQICDKACIAELNKNATLLEWPMEQVKIRQIGNVAIVTGIAHHVALFKKSNTKVKNNQRFTDTYEYKNGKWLWLSAHFTDIAPPAFTEQLVHNINKKWLENPDKAMDENYSPNYVYSDRTGSVRTFEQLKKQNSAVKFLTWETSDMSIKQNGTLAIVSGISKYSYTSLKDNSTVNNHVRGVYVFENKNGQWLLASTHHTNILPPVDMAADEAAIKKLLVEERNAFYAGDKEALAKTWKIGPTTFINASYPNGNQFYRNPEAVQKSIVDFKRIESIIGTITSSKIKVYGNNAIADLEVTANYKNGTEAKEHNIVVLEKEGDTWKIVGASVHGLQKDKKEDSAAIVKVIEKETQAFHDRDADGRIACIANVPYSVMLVHHGNMAANNGVAYVTNEKTNAPEAIKAQNAGMGKPNGSTFKNENYVVTIKGGTAFVTYTEITTAADGTKGYGHAVRNLEKIDGFWKLTYIGGVVYKP